MERANDDVVYDYLVYPFHSRPIEGMDICIKKQLVATCSSDRTVKVWSFTNSLGFQLEIDQHFSEDAKSIGFHPSGFHMVIGFADRIRMMNVFQNSL